MWSGQGALCKGDYVVISIARVVLQGTSLLYFCFGLGQDFLCSPHGTPSLPCSYHSMCASIRSSISNQFIPGCHRGRTQHYRHFQASSSVVFKRVSFPSEDVCISLKALGTIWRMCHISLPAMGAMESAKCAIPDCSPASAPIDSTLQGILIHFTEEFVNETTPPSTPSQTFPDLT